MKNERIVSFFKDELIVGSYLSTFMFIVVLGIVVDDAIIVGENVFRRRIKLKEDNFTSTVKGTMEVMLPVFLEF